MKNQAKGLLRAALFGAVGGWQRGELCENSRAWNLLLASDPLSTENICVVYGCS